MVTPGAPAVPSPATSNGVPAGGGTAQLPGGAAVYGSIPYAGYGPLPDAGDTSTLSGPGPAVSPGPQIGAGPDLSAGPEPGSDGGMQ